ncbi:MAG: choice-of-anchor J domain-containing protein [Bacteroidaceae bacterium]
MKTRYLILAASALLATACEDYTEHHFGNREDLFQPTQVNNYQVAMAKGDYAAVAQNETNRQKALAMDDDSLTYRQLLAVADNQYFTDEIAAADYVPAILRNLIGNSAYNTLTAGSSVTVAYNQYVGADSRLQPLQDMPAVSLEGTFTPSTLNRLSDAISGQRPGAQKGDMALVSFAYSEVDLPAGGEEEQVAYPCYEELTGSFTEAGKYLLVPDGLDVAIQYNPGKSYGYPYGVDIVHTSETTIAIDGNAQDATFTISKDPSGWILMNGAGQYLYMKGTYNSFNYIEDLGDLEEGEWPVFTITPNADGTYDIVNTGCGKVMLWGSAYSSAGAYLDKKGTEGYLGIRIYQLRESAPRKAPTRAINKTGCNTTAVFTFNGSAWVEHTVSGARLEAFQPADYATLGSAYVADPDAVLPAWLSARLPYAQADDEAIAVYQTKGGTGARLYTFDGKAWNHRTETEVQTVVFTFDEDGWAAKGDYLNQSLTDVNTSDAAVILSTYGWTIHHEGSIGELSYVWSASTSYGMKASAFKSNVSTPTDAWIISPVMNLKKAKEPVFAFQQAQKYAGTPLSDYLQIWVGTGYDAAAGKASASWTDVTGEVEGEWPDGTSWDYSDMQLPLQAYAGQPNVVVAFRYISTETVAATWEFKNVVCKEAE